MSSSREWIVSVLAPPEGWITANDLLGKSHRMLRARQTKAWREAVVEWAQHARLPVGLEYVRIDAVARFLGRPPVRDRDNLRPTLKACIDGLGPARTFTRNGKTYRSPGYGLIPDDSDKYLAGSDIRLGEPLSKVVTPEGHPGILLLYVKEIPRDQHQAR